MFPIITAVTSSVRAPALPVELNGVSVSVNGGAAGLYSVGDVEKQINFVVPIGTAPGLAGVVVNIASGATDTAIHGLTQVVPAQPDLFSSTNDAGGTAVTANITNPLNRIVTTTFSVTSPADSGGTLAPTIVELNLTGVRLAIQSELTVTVGTTVISGDAIVLKKSNPEMPGFDIINFTLPASLAGAGDVPIFVTFTRGSVGTTTSRNDSSAPKIHIN